MDLSSGSHEGFDGCLISRQPGQIGAAFPAGGEFPRNHADAIATRYDGRKSHSGWSRPGEMRPKRMPIYSPSSSAAINQDWIESVLSSAILASGFYGLRPGRQTKLTGQNHLRRPFRPQKSFSRAKATVSGAERIGKIFFLALPSPNRGIIFDWPAQTYQLHFA